MTATIIVSVIVAAIFAAIIISFIRDKKRGKKSCSCGGNCDTCALNCNGKKEK